MSLVKRTIKQALYSTAKKLVARYGEEIVHKDVLFEWQKDIRTKPSYNIGSSQSGAKFIDETNSFFQELTKRYAAFNKEVTNPFVWEKSIITKEDFQYFRGDNAYVWQLRGPNMNIMSYALATYYLLSLDSLNLFEKLTEDSAFGNFTFEIAGRTVSRDLLDSINELYFLDRHLQISANGNFSIFDIGAGYGRLAHRAVSAFDIRNYMCTDAVAFSSFICDYYLKFRKIEKKARVVPLDEVEFFLQNGVTTDLAVNIHSFSECTPAAINWWIERLSKANVSNLFVVPNSGSHGGQKLQTNNGLDFSQIIEKHGYELIVKEPKYADPLVQQYAINPTHYYLFRLK